MFLWCDGRCKDTPCRKRESESGLLKRQEKEEELESIFKDLKGMHADKYSLPLLRLWARMISTGIHSDMNNPPDIPSFRGGTKKPRKESLAESLTGAAVTFAKVLKESNTSMVSQVETSASPVGLSPGKTADLRMKNLEQLRYLQNLFDDGILNEEEYAEQKKVCYLLCVSYSCMHRHVQHNLFLYKRVF